MDIKLLKIIETICKKFFYYRNLEPKQMPNPLEIMKYVEQNQYYRIDTTRISPRGSRTDVVVIVLPLDSKYANYGNNLHTLIASLNASEKLEELIFVVDESFFDKRSCCDIVLGFQQKNSSPDRSGKDCFYSLYPYYRFSVVVPEHESVPKHRILPEDEAKEILKRELIKKIDFPVIFMNDPANAWIGGREGDIIEITRHSFTSGISIYYRRVIKGPPEPRQKNESSAKKHHG